MVSLRYHVDVVRERGEVREELRVDLARAVEQRHLGELVEEHEHHALRVRDADVRGLASGSRTRRRSPATRRGRAVRTRPARSRGSAGTGARRRCAAPGRRRRHRQRAENSNAVGPSDVAFFTDSTAITVTSTPANTAWIHGPALRQRSTPIAVSIAHSTAGGTSRMSSDEEDRLQARRAPREEQAGVLRQEVEHRLRERDAAQREELEEGAAPPSPSARRRRASARARSRRWPRRRRSSRLGDEQCP